ncbi:MAG TPA: hypothetical protein VNH39_07820 [Steroidobacteraceae bacterium]|nr:hypothetical protein [Steroidobacteraceae bacterium]
MAELTGQAKGKRYAARDCAVANSFAMVATLTPLRFCAMVHLLLVEIEIIAPKVRVI